MPGSISEYYNNLAPDYDRNRFGNTYGKYIDKQEKDILRKLLRENNKHKTIDIACGTGRFLEYAKTGIDISREMLKQAKIKHPDCSLFEESALQTHFPEKYFETILSFHFVMHLNKIETRKFLDEAYRILKDNGKLIFDFPSKHRRKLVSYKPDNWHAANDFSIAEIKELSEQWFVKEYIGILFFPIHRFPHRMRNMLLKIDSFICRTFFRKFASYIIVVLIKK